MLELGSIASIAQNGSPSTAGELLAWITLVAPETASAAEEVVRNSVNATAFELVTQTRDDTAAVING